MIKKIKYRTFKSVTLFISTTIILRIIKKYVIKN